MSSLRDSATTGGAAEAMHSVSVSPATLRKATVSAALGAAAIMVLIVLPAEAGIDLTGTGAALGLTRMASAAAATEPTEVAAAVPDRSLPTREAIDRGGTWRQDEVTIELAPHTGTEVKARMREGDSFVFAWRSEGGPVKVDMHGERPDAAEGEFTSYWEERELAYAQGAFTAPYAGTHGWYWRNKGETPVTVTLRATGFYEELFRPGQD
jgi:hypothetical protein